MTGICLSCGNFGVPVWQSNCHHGGPYFDVAHNCCLACGMPGVPVPVPVPPAGGPYHIAPPAPVPMPNPHTIGGLQALVARPNAAPGAGAKVQVLEKMEPPKPTEEELLKRANDAFPVLTAKELLCHRCCVIMKPRVRLSTFGSGFVAEVTCHGVTDGVALIGESDELRQNVVQMLQDIQGKDRDDWTF